MLVSIKLSLSILGMFSSYGVLAMTDFDKNQMLEGGALLAFVSFLIYAIKVLRTDLKLERDKVDKLNEDNKSSLTNEIRYSREINEKLIEELEKQREQRSSSKD